MVLLSNNLSKGNKMFESIKNFFYRYTKRGGCRESSHELWLKQCVQSLRDTQGILVNEDTKTILMHKNHVMTSDEGEAITYLEIYFGYVFKRTV